VTTENTEAAQADPLEVFVQGPIDQGTEQAPTENQSTESAPVVDATKPEATEAEKPKEDGFQKRIDKVTADKYTEKRRADDLQKRVDAFEASKAKETLQKPKLDDPAIDYDEEAFDKANRDYEIKQGVQDALAQQSAEAKAEQQKTAVEKVQGDYNDRVSALGKADFTEKQNAIPNLPAGVADAIMQSELGAEMVYHLGSPENAEQANAMANMTPAMAMMELGKLSVQLSAKPEIKPSAAPDPITPLSSGGSALEVNEDDMSMDEWMAKNG
jgi:hypothetical protein